MAKVEKKEFRMGFKEAKLLLDYLEGGYKAIEEQWEIDLLVELTGKLDKYVKGYAKKRGIKEGKEGERR